MTDEADEREQARVIVVEEGLRSDLLLERDVLKIGRAADNDLRLRDKVVSRHHCRLERLGREWFIVDLSSQNGTLVNGLRIERRPLEDGDLLQIGRARITFAAAGESSAMGRETAIIHASTRAEDTAAEAVEGEMKRERDDLLVLQRINRALNSETQLGPLLELIIDSAIALTRAERGFLILDRGGEMVFEVARNFAGETPAFKISKTIADQVCESARPILTINAQDDQRFAALASVTDLHLRSVLCIPLFIKEHPRGVIYVDNRLQDSVFTEEDLDLLEALGVQAAIAISNAQLVEDLRASNEELALQKGRVEQLNTLLATRAGRSERELSHVRRELGWTAADRPRYPGIIGESPAMQEVFNQLDRIVESEYPVLIQGVSGTGKELIARAIHERGARSHKRFITENCGAFPDDLLESELFGHVKGAFTGAHRSKKGLLELADGGTLFLDEVGEMSVQMQKKLLRVLQEGEIRPLGSDRIVDVDVRILSASNRELQQLVAQGEFREDLFYRLNVLVLRLPPLCERRSDIPLLIDYFLETFCRESGRERLSLDAEVLQACQSHDWPGNVRELQNEVRKWIVLADRTVRPEHLAPSIRSPGGAAPTRREDGRQSLPERVAALESEAIREVLERCGGNKSRAAKELGISRFTLQRKLDKYGLAEDT